MRAVRSLYLLLAIVLSLAALAACSKAPEQRALADGEPAEPLPAPAGSARGVTGMPDEPGPGPVGPPPEAGTVPAVALDQDGNPVLPQDSPVETLPTPTDLASEPTPEEAVAVIRDYYAAINRGDFDRAYALWSDGGRASAQSPEQFAAGFAQTTGVSAELMPPGRVDAAAGSRYIEVPVAITTTLRDGSQHRFVGAYVLRRAVVDGATDEQRQWRIGSADLREVRP